MGIIKKLTTVLMAGVVAVSMTACSSFDSQICAGENAPLCIFLALAIGGVAFELLAGTGVVFHHALISDERLKTDVQLYKKLPNGINVYGYRYKGDSRVFLGVKAQEVLADKRFSSAVTKGKDGFYRVNYAKLGLKIANGETMRSAGEAAAKRMQ